MVSVLQLVMEQFIITQFQPVEKMVPWFFLNIFPKTVLIGCPILDTHVSGSSIIQDGKLVGAVTHVLVNDPTTGYGIFIENMLDAAA